MLHILSQSPSLERLEAELGRSFQIGLLNLPRFEIVSFSIESCIIVLWKRKLDTSYYIFVIFKVKRDPYRYKHVVRLLLPRSEWRIEEDCQPRVSKVAAYLRKTPTISKFLLSLETFNGINLSLLASQSKDGHWLDQLRHYSLGFVPPSCLDHSKP